MWPQNRSGIFCLPRAHIRVVSFCRFGVIASVGWWAGCSAAPVNQIHYFSNAFDAVNTVGQPLLDDLAVAERQQGQSNAANPANGASCSHSMINSGGDSVMLGFCVEDAAYFSDIGDPPATQKFRAGLAVVHGYIDLLLSLADGKSASDAVAQVNVLEQKVAALVGTFGGPGAGGVIGVAITDLQPVLEDAAQQLSVRQVRRVILQGDPQVTALIDALVKSAPSVFDTVTGPTLIRLGNRNSPTFAADKARYGAYRKIVSNYVVLLGQLREAWTQTVAATKAPSPPTLADVANRVGQLQADSAAILRVYAALRTGTVVTTP